MDALATTADDEVRIGAWRVRTRRVHAFGLVLDGLVDAPPGDWLHEVLRAPADREALFELVDREGLVICRDVHTAHPSYRDVRGRSSRGRLSQGESYHHDGCSSPTRPRIVEIRCPHQPIERYTRTAIAPFPQTVIAMLDELPARLRASPDARDWIARMDESTTWSAAQWDLLQGALNRIVRRGLSTDAAREYLCEVDVRVGAYREPWSFGESRLIANDNAGRTMQHRRAYLEPPSGRANGHLLKRWPAEELDAPASPRCDADGE